MVAPYRATKEPPVHNVSVITLTQTRRVMLECCNYFFVMSLDYEMLCNKKDEVFVFTKLAQAEEYAINSSLLSNGFQVVGLGPNKWKLFQDTEPYVIVEE